MSDFGFAAKTRGIQLFIEARFVIMAFKNGVQ